jgi:hypothetical protein
LRCDVHDLDQRTHPRRGHGVCDEGPRDDGVQKAARPPKHQDGQHSSEGVLAVRVGPTGCGPPCEDEEGLGRHSRCIDLRVCRATHVPLPQVRLLGVGALVFGIWDLGFRLMRHSLWCDHKGLGFGVLVSGGCGVWESSVILGLGDSRIVSF